MDLNRTEGSAFASVLFYSTGFDRCLACDNNVSESVTKQVTEMVKVVLASKQVKVLLLLSSLLCNLGQMKHNMCVIFRPSAGPALHNRARSVYSSLIISIRHKDLHSI